MLGKTIQFKTHAKSNDVGLWLENGTNVITIDIMTRQTKMGNDGHMKVRIAIRCCVHICVCVCVYGSSRNQGTELRNDQWLTEIAPDKMRICLYAKTGARIYLCGTKPGREWEWMNQWMGAIHPKARLWTDGHRAYMRVERVDAEATLCKVIINGIGPVICHTRSH